MSRCQVCREPLESFDPPRAGSDLDTICNELVNPRNGKPEAPANHPEAREGRQGWRPRQAVLRRIWLSVRSPNVGWGDIPFLELRQRFERAMRTYYA